MRRVTSSLFFHHRVRAKLTPPLPRAPTHPCSAALLAGYEGLLFPPFQMILSADVAEFAPYVFQIIAQLMVRAPRCFMSTGFCLSRRFCSTPGCSGR